MIRSVLALIAWSCVLCAPALAQTTQPTFTPPELVAFEHADYPPEAKAQGLAATVLLEVLVDEEGHSAEVKVLEAAGHGFDEAAVVATKKFVWKPGRSGAKAVKVRVTYAYHFTLEAAPQDEPESSPQGQSTLRGVVVERGTRQPLFGVDVAAVAEGESDAAAQATTDESGRFELVGLAAGTYRIVLLLGEFQRGELKETVADKQTLEVRYLLERVAYNPYQATIRGAPLREEIERHEISIAEATKIPGTSGDALRAIENMPGVARPPLGVGLIVVRGSNPEDTTPYIAGHWVPFLYHFGGIKSLINSDLLERLDFLPGNFSARYGRAIGGVLNVELRAPRRDRHAGYVDLNLIDSGFLLEGPLEKGSYALAARRSYIDAVLAAVLPEDSGLSFTTAPVYYDYQALFDRPALGGRWQTQIFGGGNRLTFILDNPSDLDPELHGTIANDTAFHRLQSSLRKSIGPGSDLGIYAATGYGTLNFGIGELLKFNLDIWFNSYRVELSKKRGRHRFLLGTEGQLYTYDLFWKGHRAPQEGDAPKPPSSFADRQDDRSDFEWLHGVYMEDELTLGDGLTVTEGLRLDYYRSVNAFAWDPRLTVKWQTGGHTFRGGIGRFSEQPQPWESNPLFGNPELLPKKAVHASVGYDWQIAQPLRLETTFFYKWLSDLIVVGENVLSSGGTDPRLYNNDGLGRVYGAEVLLRHAMTKRFFGWISYSLSRAERKDHYVEPWRPFSFDQTHGLSVVASMKLPWRIEAGARFRYVTGNPQTPILGSYFDSDNDVYYPVLGTINSERVPAFHQLDVRIDKRFVFDSWMLTAYLDLQNAYNRLNPEAYFFSYDYRKKTTVTGLPIIPSLGIKGEF
jgi:TonB family protein